MCHCMSALQRDLRERYQGSTVSLAYLPSLVFCSIVSEFQVSVPEFILTHVKLLLHSPHLG